MSRERADVPTETSLTALVSRAVALAQSPGRRVLGIAGPPGAGKSTVTAALLEALGSQCVIVPMDGFHLSNETLIDLGRRARKGAPDTFDVAGYSALLRRIRAGEPVVYAPRFDRELEEAIGSAIPVRADVPLVVTEGNYLLHDSDGWTAIRPLLDEVWYLDVPREEIRRRLVSRRIGHGHAPEPAAQWVRDVDEPNAAIVERSRGRADLRVALAHTAYPAASHESQEER